MDAGQQGGLTHAASGGGTLTQGFRIYKPGSGWASGQTGRQGMPPGACPCSGFRHAGAGRLLRRGEAAGRSPSSVWRRAWSRGIVSAAPGAGADLLGGAERQCGQCAADVYGGAFFSGVAKADGNQSEVHPAAGQPGQGSIECAPGLRGGAGYDRI
ncbi:hypothetical protein D3C75_657150 [compost metagenome]